jgi:hypothetical protein
VYPPLKAEIFGNLFVAIHESVLSHRSPRLITPHYILMISSFFYKSRASRPKFRSRIFHTTSLCATRFNSSLTRLQPSHIYNMAAAPSELADKLESLDVSEPLPKYPNCFPEVNPVDIYRSHLSSILTKVTGVDANIIYPALQWTQTLEKGDLVLPVPALRVKGKKPNELAEEWVSKVFPLRPNV